MLARNLLAGGAGLALPIFTSGRLEGRIEEAEANLEVLHRREEEVKQEVAFEVRAAHLRLHSAVDSLPPLRLGAESARQASRLAAERYRECLGTIVELTQAQAAVAEASAAEAAGLLDVKIAESELRFATGHAAR